MIRQHGHLLIRYRQPPRLAARVPFNRQHPVSMRCVRIGRGSARCVGKTCSRGSRCCIASFQDTGFRRKEAYMRQYWNSNTGWHCRTFQFRPRDSGRGAESSRGNTNVTRLWHDSAGSAILCIRGAWTRIQLLNEHKRCNCTYLPCPCL